MKTNLPVVALVGRPNVGKSRLFNRFARARLAIVEDTPGVTRDRNMTNCHWNGCRFRLIDTGGFEPESKDILLEQMRYQAQLAVEEADVILFILDGRAGLLPADLQIAEILRKSDKRIIACVNKIDSHKNSDLFYEFYSLGFDEIFAISAEHGMNFDELAYAVTRDFVEEEEPEDYWDAESEEDIETNDEAYDEADESDETFEDDEGFEGEEWSEYVVRTHLDKHSDEELEALPDNIDIAVVGRPNTGKSTLINQLLGYKRLLTADIAGTTRDTIDTELTDDDGQVYTLIDTAGIRRKRTISQRIEKFSVVKAIQAIERADVVIILIDALEGIADQDLKIAALALDRGCALAILINKWDAVENKNDGTAKEIIDATREKLTFCQHVPIYTISALTGTRTHKILQTAKSLYKTASMRISTGELNRVFKRIIEENPPPTINSKRLKLYFIQQVAVRPPTFVIQGNAPKLLPESYKRFILNQLRAYYGFEGSPVRVLYRQPAGRRKWVKKK